MCGEELGGDPAQGRFLGDGLCAVLAELGGVPVVALGPGAARAVEAVLLVDLEEGQRGAYDAHLLLGDPQGVADGGETGRQRAAGSEPAERPGPDHLWVAWQPWRSPSSGCGSGVRCPILSRASDNGCGRGAEVRVVSGSVAGSGPWQRQHRRQSADTRGRPPDAHGRAFPGVPGVLRAARGELHDRDAVSRRTRSTASRRCWRTRCATSRPRISRWLSTCPARPGAPRSSLSTRRTASKTPDEFKGQVELIGELLDAMHVDAVRGGRLRGGRCHRHARHAGRGRGLRGADRHRRPRLLPAGHRPRHGAVSDQGCLGADPLHAGEGRGEVRA